MLNTFSPSAMSTPPSTMPSAQTSAGKRPTIVRLHSLPKDTLMKIVQYLMPKKHTSETWIGHQIIQRVLPFACVSRSCCQAVLGVFDVYEDVFFVNGVYGYIQEPRVSQPTHSNQQGHRHSGVSDALLYRAAALAFSVLCSNCPCHEPILLWSEHMVRHHSRCCCRSTSLYILGLLKFDCKSLSIGLHSQACAIRSWGYMRLNLCEYSTCLVKAEVFVLKRCAVQSLQILGLSLYPHHIVSNMLEKLLESCQSTLTTLIITDTSSPVMLALRNAARKLRHLRTLEIHTDLSESVLRTRLHNLFSALVSGNVRIHTLSLSHRHNLSNISFTMLPSSLNRMYLSSKLFTLPKQLNSASLQVLHIRSDRFQLSELLRLAKCSKLPQLEEIRIHYETAQFKNPPRELIPEERAILRKVCHMHAAFRTGSFRLAVGELLDREALLTYNTMFSQLRELSASFYLRHARQFASYLSALRHLTKLRLSTAIATNQGLSFSARQMEQSSHLIDALRRSRAPLRSLRLNGVYSTKETYNEMMHTFRESLERLEMMMHSPWGAGGRTGLVGLQIGCADVMEVLWGVLREETKLQYVGFGFAVGMARRKPFDHGRVLETFWSVQELMLDRGVVHFASDCSG